MSTHVKPKIAILTIRNSYKFGGVLATVKVVHDFCKQYFDPTLFYLSFDPDVSAHLRPLKFSSENKNTEFEEMNAVAIGSRWSFWEPGHYKFTYDQWKRALADYEYIFVVSATPLAGHPAQLLKKKYVMWISTPYEHDRNERIKHLSMTRYAIDLLAQPFMRKIEYNVLLNAQAVMALSSYSEEQFQKILAPHEKKIIRCGYPIDIVQPLSFENKEQILLAVGRYNDPRKNFYMLMRVFERLHQKLPRLKLYIIGQKPEQKIINQFSAWSSFSSVFFTGPLEKQELELYYKKSDIMLITSYQEGFGITGLEALAHGIPVVTTDCGGVRDFVIHDETGYIVPINQDMLMTEYITHLLTDRQTYIRLQKNALEYAQKHFSYNFVHSIYKKTLQEVYPELEAWFNLFEDNSKRVYPSSSISIAL